MSTSGSPGWSGSAMVGVERVAHRADGPPARPGSHSSGLGQAPVLADEGEDRTWSSVLLHVRSAVRRSGCARPAATSALCRRGSPVDRRLTVRAVVAGVGAEQEGRRAEAEQAEVVRPGRRGAPRPCSPTPRAVGAVGIERVVHRRRHDVVEEAAPLVVVDEHRTRAPVRRAHEGGRDVAVELLAEADVGVGVVVVGEPFRGDEERVDEGDLGQRAGRAVGVVLGDRSGVGRVPRPPEAERRQVREVVLPRDPPALSWSHSVGQSQPAAHAGFSDRRWGGKSLLAIPWAWAECM